MAWTEDRVERLAELWNAGHSAAEIAALLGEVTRNAVIGKVHRLGLSGRPSPIRRARRVERPAPRPRPVVGGVVDRPCQWPFGDPSESDFYFCGLEAESGRPYCTEHVARAYQRVSVTPDQAAAEKAA